MRFTQHVKTEKELKVDLKDKKILYWLSENARMPYTKIAKNVGLSKDSVKYRINNLEKNGVIQGYLSIIDISKLGYDTYHLFLKLNKINKELRNELVEIFKSYSFIKVVIEFSGKHDFEIGIAAKDVEELDIKLAKIIDDVSQYIQEYQILTIIRNYETRTFPRSFIDMKNRNDKKKINSRFKIDKKDLKILKILSENARLPLYKIGNLTNLSADAINYRIKNLISKNVILKHVPIINYSVLGYTIYTILMNIHNLTQEKEKILERFLRTNKNTLWAVKTIGKYNLLMYICVKKSDDLHQTLIKLRELFSLDIKDYETLVAYEEYIYSYCPLTCTSMNNQKL